MGKLDDAFLDNLNRELRKIEEQTFKASALAGVAHARDKMIGVMRVADSGRYERGLAVRDYRNQYRVNGCGSVWREEAGPGEKIARADGNSNARSTDNWIAEAEFAEPLGNLLREAFLPYNLEPTEKRNRDIVIALVDRTQQDRPHTLDDALRLVGEVLAERSHRKRVQRDVSADELRERVVTRVVKFIKEHPERTWTVTLEEISEKVRERLKSEQQERRAIVESQRRATALRAGADGLNCGIRATAPRTAGPKFTTAAKSGSPTPRNPSRPRGGRKYLHPWGDASLDVLELLPTVPGGNQTVRFHRKRLYDVGKNLKPTRYLVAGKLDMFDPGLAEGAFDELLEVFRKADWHTFLALTPHADSIQRHGKRWKLKLCQGFPTNFWPGVTVDSVDHLSRITTLRKACESINWVSLVDYHSDPSRLLFDSTLRSDIRGTRLVVFGWDFASRPSPVLSEDAYVLAKVATEPEQTNSKQTDRESAFFFAHPKSRQAFVTGDSKISDLPQAMNPRVKNEKLKAMLDRAQSKQELPQEWLRRPFFGREGVFNEFTGEEVQLFDYCLSTGTDPILTVKAT
ncbi:MAG: DUF5131 family protein [Acidobacteriota bacterium]